ncbi:MAG TPA: hypothetical protein VGY55_03830 [Pirellulales bacterium]|jgi:hypothetical protein|nr:hypothetical protein [Pirellulales bacterium]
MDVRSKLLCLCVAGYLLLLAGWPKFTAAESPQPRAIDESRVRAAGIRKLTSKRLTLYTDMPSAAVVDELPEIFDQAVPQWCAYFGVDESKLADWHHTACLMQDKMRFEASGLLPPSLPPFLNGYTVRHESWVNNQTTDKGQIVTISDYYRRHLLLHEGTHAFMINVLVGIGPPWYAEGMAELLGTHRWRDGRLQLDYFPARPAEVSKLGRIELVETDVANHRGRTLAEVLAYDAHAHLKVEPYAWSWAATAFLDNHPRYRDRFHEVWRFAAERNFNKRFAEKFADDGAQLAEEFQVFASDITYGYDFSRTAIDFTPGKPLPSSHARVVVDADRGWQNSGLMLEAGTTYHLAAAGRYQVAKEPRIWWSEPGGISIRYFHGKPLGVLLGAVRLDHPANGDSPLASPIVVGLGATIHPEKSGTLYLRTNVPSGEFKSAAGSLTVEISRD